MNNNTILKLILALTAALFVSFWGVVIVGGLYIHKAVQTINSAQQQIETAVDSLQDINITDINKTVESLKEAGSALESLYGIVTGSGGDTEK